MTSYYVDPTLGSDSDAGTSTAAPWKTLAKVAATTDFAPGDSILFKCGETFQGEYLTIPCDGTSDAPITFSSYTTGSTDAPIFDGTVVYTDWAVHSGSVYKRTDVSADISQVFEGDTRLTYKTASSDLVNGSWCYVTSVVYVQSLDGTDPNDHAVGYGRIDNGVIFPLNGKSHLVFDGLEAKKYNYCMFNTGSSDSDDILIENCTGSFGGSRMCLIGVTTAGAAMSPSNITMRNCIGHDDLDVPFWIGHGTNLIVEYCEAYYNGKDVTPEAKSYPTSHYPDGICISADAVDCIVRYNYVHDNYIYAAIQDEQSLGARSNGLLIYGNHVDTSINACYGISVAGANTTVYNNWVNAGSGSAFICANTPTNVKVYNNTFISPSGSQNSIDCTNQVMTSFILKNNVVIRAGATNRYVNVAAASQPAFTCDANLYYGASTGKWFWGPTEYTSLATWQGACTGGDTGAVNADPLMVSASTNPRIGAASPARNAGLDLSGTFTEDYDRNTRDATFDMGAFEYPLLTFANATQSQTVDNLTLTYHDAVVAPPDELVIVHSQDPAYPDAIFVEMQFNGTTDAWTDVTRDVSRVDGITVRYGMGATGPKDRVADTGSMTFSMKNDQSNSAGLLGYYSPGNVNCRVGFKTGITVRLRVVYDGVSKQKFYGQIPAGGISIMPGKYGERRVNVEVLDFMEQTAIHDLYLPTYTTNKRADEIVPLIVSNMPIGPTNTDYNVCDDTFGYVFDTVRQQTKAATEFQKLAISELGYVYVLPTDTLVVEGRSTRTGTALTTIPVVTVDAGFLLQETSDFLLQENGDKIILNQTYSLNLDDLQSEMEVSHGRDMYNQVEATAYPRLIDTAPSVLFELNSPLQIDAGETKNNYNVTYKDTVTNAPTVSGFNMISPSSDDYEMHTSPATSDTNSSSDLTVAVTYGTEGAVYTLTNSGAVAGYITTLQARGYGIYLYDPVTFIASSSDNLTLYGTNKLSLDMKYQDDPGDAEAFTNILLGLYKEPRTTADSVTFFANKNGELMGAFMYCDIGSKVHICETVSGIDDDFFINGVEFTITDKNIIKYTWIVKSASKDVMQFWQLASATYSQLGATTVLGFGT